MLFRELFLLPLFLYMYNFYKKSIISPGFPHSLHKEYKICKKVKKLLNLNYWNRMSD